MFFSDLIKAIRELITALVVQNKLASQTNEVLGEIYYTLLGLRNDLNVNSIALNELRKVIGLRKPGLCFITVLKENDDMLVFILTLPALSAPDVKARDLTVKIGDGEPALTTFEGEALHSLKSGEYKGKDNDTVSVSIVDIDDAGNRSEPRVQDFTLVDNLAPPMPGEIGIQVVREEDDPTPPTE